MDTALDHPFLKKPNRTILALSVPVTLSLVAEPITGLVDTAFVARLGAEPLAALGIGTTALSSMFWIFNFLSISAQTEVAQAMGARNHARAAQISSLALILGAFFSLLVMAVFIPSAAEVSRLLGGVGAVQADATTYLQLRLLGAPAVLLSLIGLGVLRGMQDMRTPLWIAVLVNAINIVLDAPLIFGLGVLPGLGVGGAALASTIAQWIGALLVLHSIRRRLGLTWYVNRADVLALLKIGGDLFVRTGLLTAFLLLTTRVANQISPEAGAAHQAIRTVWIFSGLMLDGLAVTAQSLIGYFLGADARPIARRSALYSMGWALGVGLSLALLMLLGTNAVLRALVPAEAAAVFLTAWWVASLAQPMNALAFVTDGIHWGTSDYAFLRNAMLGASFVGGAAVLLVDPQAAQAFQAIWLATALWILVRMALGVGRIWPGIGKSPLRISSP